MSDNPSLRVGHAERDGAVERLRIAAAEGRLTLEELDERLGAALTAKTQGDLDALLADLPATTVMLPHPSAPHPAIAEPGYAPDDPLVLSGGWKNETREGPWKVPPYIEAHPVGANVKLDCLEATTEADLIDLTIVGGMGTTTVVVPEGWGVNVVRLDKGMGTVSSKVPDQPSWGYPVIVVHGGVGVGTFKARHANWFDKKRLGIEQ